MAVGLQFISVLERERIIGFAILNSKGEIIEAQQIDPFGEELANIISYAAEKVSY